MKYLGIMISLCLLTGCQQTRSFLQMDSNSSSPFLGLELSVDAGNPASSPRPSGRTAQDQLSVKTVSYPIEGKPADGQGGNRTADEAQVEYSLPLVRMDANPGEAAEVEEILSRLAGT
ncbi:MAG: hypothetical protein RIK87_10065 [Fuerstiella sp.]